MAMFVRLFSNIAKARCRVQVAAAKYSSISKEMLDETSNKDGLAKYDVLMGNLKSTKSTRDVLKVVKQHGLLMTEKHLLQALRTLFNLQKSGRSDLSTHQILKQTEFDLLCTQLRRYSGTIELNDTIEALKVINYVGVSSDSTIVQVLLQLLKHQINQLSLHQIIFLDFLFMHMKETPLIEAMNIALPIVFEIQLPYKLDRTNLEQICDCLQFAVKKNLHQDTTEYLIRSIENDRGEISARAALSLLWSLCDLEPKGYYEPILKKLMDALMVHMDTLKFGEMETTLSKLTSRFSHNFQFYYNDVFFDTCTNYMIDEDKGFNIIMHLARKCTKVGHENSLLMEYMTNKIVQNPSIILDESDPLPAYNTINYVALTDYRPNKWLELKEILSNVNSFKKCYRKEVYWIRLAASLFILEIDKPEVMEELFRTSNLHKMMRQGSIWDAENLILVKQGISLFKPEYLHMLDHKYLIDRIINRSVIAEDFPLEGALKAALGGENYVQTNLTSDLNHKIDHVFVLRKGGYPVSIASKKEIRKIEDIDVGLYNQIVVVLGLSSIHYTLNTNRLKSYTLYTIKTLETQGYTVVPICLSSWTDLEDYEKNPYLMNAIKEKTGKDEFAYKL